MAGKAWRSAPGAGRRGVWRVRAWMTGAWIAGLLVGNLLLFGPGGMTPRLMAQAAQPPASPDIPDTVVPPLGHIYLPTIVTDARARCPLTSENSYSALPVQGGPRQSAYTPADDPDLNLAVRGYVTLPGLRQLVNIHGPTDDDAPQLAALFRPPRVPTFSALHRVHDWDWQCSDAPAELGCRGELLAAPEYTAVSMVTVGGETLYPPARRPNIMPGGYIALVLYAEEEQITFTYTREDSPAHGYLIHLDNFCVDPNLLALYRSLDEAGRDSLPALTDDDPLGTALTAPVVVAVRDSGSFMDPRSAKDWWQEAAARLRAAAAAGPITPDP